MAALIWFNSCFFVRLFDLLCCSSDLALLFGSREIGEKEGNSRYESDVPCSLVYENRKLSCTDSDVVIGSIGRGFCFFIAEKEENY